MARSMSSPAAVSRSRGSMKHPGIGIYKLRIRVMLSKEPEAFHSTLGRWAHGIDGE